MILSTISYQFRCIQVAQLPGGAPQLPTTQEQPLEEIKVMATIQPWTSHQTLSKSDVSSVEVWIISKELDCNIKIGIFWTLTPSPNIASCSLITLRQCTHTLPQWTEKRHEKGSLGNYQLRALALGYGRRGAFKSICSHSHTWRNLGRYLHNPTHNLWLAEVYKVDDNTVNIVSSRR